LSRIAALVWRILRILGDFQSFLAARPARNRMPTNKERKTHENTAFSAR
jgi:hypothetical protein